VVQTAVMLAFVSMLVMLLGITMIRSEGNPEVVCFGDSITNGAMVNGKSWVYFLSEEHRKVDFVNAGRNGRKTSDKDEILPIISEYHGAELLLIMLGVNDLKDGNDSLVDDCVSNVDWMIHKVREASQGTRIILIAPPEISLRKMSQLNVGKEYNGNTFQALRKLSGEYEKLSKRDSVGFLSLLNTVSPDNFVDGLHPDLEGQRQIAEKIWRLLSAKFGLK